MFDAQVKSNAPYVTATLSLLQDVLADYHPRDFAVRLWDGSIWQQEAGQPRNFTIILNHPGALRRMFFPATQRRLGEAYISSDFDIEGNLIKAMNLAKYLWLGWHWTDTVKYAWRLMRLPSENAIDNERFARLSGHRHSINRDKQAIQYHYDVSNEFYQLWLDSNMVYSCAYFESPNDSIDTAQLRKLDYLCQKLRLKEGERLLDIGCGWGALIIHAARKYGVDATGVTLSEKQAEYARKRIADTGLQDRCRVHLLDYREADELHPFDKIVSVGMVEHVGRNKLSEYFNTAYRLLRPGGVFLNHGITSSHEEFSHAPMNKDSFIQQYVFPDGDIQSISYVLTAAEKAGFEVRDVENLREHYALTLKNWLQCLEAQKPTIVEMMDTVAYRLWRIYLASARWLFEYGSHGLHQTLLYKLGDDPTQTHLPLQRKDWYIG